MPHTPKNLTIIQPFGQKTLDVRRAYATLRSVKKNGSKNWEGAVQGRTSNQCYKVWNQTLDPYLKNAIMSKGKAGRGGL
ncbi:hypothetical protein V866_006244 [Kwoniella sp. B9012]